MVWLHFQGQKQQQQQQRVAAAAVPVKAYAARDTHTGDTTACVSRADTVASFCL
jgi:hypothetical protein